MKRDSNRLLDLFGSNKFKLICV